MVDKSACCKKADKTTLRLRKESPVSVSHDQLQFFFLGNFIRFYCMGICNCKSIVSGIQMKSHRISCRNEYSGSSTQLLLLFFTSASLNLWSVYYREFYLHYLDIRYIRNPGIWNLEARAEWKQVLTHWFPKRRMWLWGRVCQQCVPKLFLGWSTLPLLQMQGYKNSKHWTPHVLVEWFTFEVKWKTCMYGLDTQTTHHIKKPKKSQTILITSRKLLVVFFFSFPKNIHLF